MGGATFVEESINSSLNKGKRERKGGRRPTKASRRN